MDYKLIIAIIAAVFLIAGYIPYLKDIFAKKTKPHMFTWLIWCITQGTATVALLEEGLSANGLTTTTTRVCWGSKGQALPQGDQLLVYLWHT